MQQRRLRLGDILDDYCPRERRVTNHVVVAMIEDEVKQTRCSTCDAEHEYKEARVPPPRRRKEAGVLSSGVASDATRVRRPETQDHVDTLDPLDPPDAMDLPDEPVGVDADVPLSAAAVVDVEVASDEPVSQAGDDDGPVHRRLIRATFPRPEGQTPERREPDFTIRQQGRGGPREVDGNRGSQGQKRHRRPHRGGGRQGDVRFGGSPQGQGNGQRGGGGQPGNHRGGGPSQHGQPGGGNQPGNRGNGGRPGGEGRFRRRRGR